MTGQQSQDAIKYLRKGGLVGGAIGTAVGGAAGAGLGYLPKHEYKYDSSTGRTKKTTLTHKQRVGNAVSGGIGLGMGGGLLGSSLGAGRRLGKIHTWSTNAEAAGGGHEGYKAWEQTPWMKTPKAAKPPAWAKGVKTKADLQKAYRAHSRKNHPDLVTDPAEKARRHPVMQKIIEENESFGNTLKTAQMNAFFDELGRLNRG